MEESFNDKMGYKSPFGENNLFNESLKSDSKAIVRTADKAILEKINQEKQEEKKKEDIQKKGKDKKEINLLIVFDEECVEQFNDAKNEIWIIKHIQTFADLNFFKELIKEFSFKNICIIHHGTVFSDHTFNKDNKVKLPASLIKAIKETLKKIGEIPVEIDDLFISKVHEKSKTMYKIEGEAGIKEIYLKSFFSLKLLIENIVSEGNLLSVACKEVTSIDTDMVSELASFSNKNIKLYASSNYAIINHTSIEPEGTENPDVRFGCVFNLFLTDVGDWTNKNGWFYYDTKLGKTFASKKDLWLYSIHKSKVFDLIERKTELTVEQIRKENYAQRYFSKRYEAYYTKKFKKSAYDIWKKGVEKVYPEFKK